jgi:signal transduction histidine kinase/ActR/RegA family two-component response regulator
MAFSDLPIRRKLRWVYLLTSGLALLLASIAYVSLEIATFRERLVEVASMQADIVGYNCASAIAFDDRKAATETLRALRVDPEILAAAVYAPDGLQFASYVRGGAPLPPELSATMAPADGRARFGRDALLVHEDVIVDGELLGTVRVLSSLARLDAFLYRYAGVVAVVFLASLAAAWPLLTLLQRVITTPIMELVDKARIVSSQKDYGVRATRTSADELGLLVDTFNEMLAEIQQRDAELERARDVAESANRAKDEFLAVVSHELRTPLTPILAWARMQRAQQLDASELQRAAEIIERNAKSQAQLIEDLLDVSRITTGKLRLDVRAVDINGVVEASVDGCRPTAEIKGIRLRAVLDPRAGVVSGDPERLRQVVANLLSNAIKFTPKGGKVQVLLQRANSHVAIVVTDTGRGIAPEFLPYVFERFRQADSSSSRLYGGLGLGLSIVRHIVELHGGTIRAESPGEDLGATFTVELPIAALATDAPATRGAARHPVTTAGAVAPRAEDRTLAGLRVLVVDDDDDTLQTVRLLLEQRGAEVRTAASAAGALQQLATWRPDVLISDIGMPHEDGYELIRRIRALPAARGGRVPALALTAFARVEDRMHVLRAGFQMHVPKPIEPDELIAVVASLAEWTPRDPRGDA